MHHTGMLHDFRFAFRQLVKARAFTAAAVIVLALGIGANTAIFSLMNTLLFQPPHYAKANEVVQVFSQDKKNPKTFRGFSYPTYVDIREQNSVFSGVMAHNLAMVGVGDKGSTRRAFTDVVSSNYFSVMGVMPMQGRAFRAEEETPGRNSAVAIVSYNYWKREGLNPAMLGLDHYDRQPPFHRDRNHAARIHRHDAGFRAGDLAAARGLRSGRERFRDREQGQAR